MLSEIISLLESSFAKRWIIKKEIQDDVIIIYLNKDYLNRFLFFIKEEKRLLFNQLIDMYAVDFTKSNYRFQINYNLLSIFLRTRLKIKINFCEGEAISSITDVFPNAMWYEREIWDMFGIFFKRNDNLCRIINERNFAWFPLRKDFPLKGVVNLKYSSSEERFLYQKKKD